MPGYEGRVAYVDVLTTDAAAAPVLKRYPTQYIPTSIFVDGTGTVAETFVGPLSEVQMREKLDSLL
ncbi:MAG: TlpA family protein disulfide reductase [Coriobacteriia bacterium]